MKTLTARQVALWSFLGTVIMELITVLFRFGFNLQSTRDTASTVGVLTHGIRIHHGYFGILLLILAIVWFRSRPPVSRWLMVIGLALVASDLVHHFLVLWPLTGSPEFDLFYPKQTQPM